MMSQASMFSLSLSLIRDRDRETVGLFLSDKIGSDQMRVCNLPGNNLHGDIERQTRQKWFTLSIKYFARTSYQNIFPSSIEIFFTFESFLVDAVDVVVVQLKNTQIRKTWNCAGGHTRDLVVGQVSATENISDSGVEYISPPLKQDIWRKLFSNQLWDIVLNTALDKTEGSIFEFLVVVKILV